MKITGVVKWFNDAKGYGFIDAENRVNIFVHYSKIIGEGFKTLQEGDVVEFDLYENEKGLQALNVERVGRKSK